jgi:hypothetical protein
MRENDKDETFILGKDKPPPIIACIIHPSKRSVKTFTADGTTDFAGATYGLCSRCTRRLRAHPAYQITIEDEISRRLNALKEEKQNADK